MATFVLQTARQQLEAAAAAGLDLSNIDLTEADLTVANLTNANLTNANLTGANLTRADLTGANLTGANLTDADLTRADLTGADLTGANLTYANLTGADLRHTMLPPPSMLLLANWDVVSDDLCRDLMVYDADNHPDPSRFDHWAVCGACPYVGVRVQRSAHFHESRRLWTPGRPVQSAYRLMIRLLIEKCASSDFHDPVPPPMKGSV